MCICHDRAVLENRFMGLPAGQRRNGNPGRNLFSYFIPCILDFSSEKRLILPRRWTKPPRTGRIVKYGLGLISLQEK